MSCALSSSGNEKYCCCFACRVDIVVGAKGWVQKENTEYIMCVCDTANQMSTQTIILYNYL